MIIIMEAFVLLVMASSFFFVPFIVIGAIIFVVIIQIRREAGRARQVIANFGTQHGMTAAPQDFKYKGLLPGKISTALSGIDASTKRQSQLIYLPHVVGAGRNRREYRRTVIGLSIKPTKQHIYVNARLNDMTEQMPAGQYVRYQAEGQFSKYFDIYTPEGKQVTALSLFAPDLMAHLMADFGAYDIEIIDDQLYVYEYSALTDAGKLEELYRLCLALAGEFDSNAPRLPSLQLASGAPDTSAVTTMHGGEGKRIVVALIAVAAFYGIGAITQLADGTSAAPYLSFGNFLLVVVVFGLAAYGFIKNKRLNKQYAVDRQQFLEGIKKTDQE